MIGEQLGPFRLLRQLGSGGMGEVWLAERDGVQIALKLLHWHLSSNPPFVVRFLREGEIGMRVRHANVAATLDVGTVPRGDDAYHYIAIEYAEGWTLREILDEQGRVPEALCRVVGREIAKGLAAIHAAGAIHRDVKPENVLITRDDLVKLADFGVARPVDDSERLSTHGAFAGTVQYAAPEQFRTRDLDGRADLFALGIVLFELAAGEHPYAGADTDHGGAPQIRSDAPPLGARNPQVSPFFAEVVRTLLERDRSRRFPSPRELVAVLEAGEGSVWWRNRSRAMRAETGRPLRRVGVAAESATFGRDADLDTLRALARRVAAGDGEVVLVEGGAGSGKTRLLRDFAAALAEGGEPVNVLSGAHTPRGGTTGALSIAYREHFGTEGLADALRIALPESPHLVAAFAAFLRGDVAPAGSEPLTAETLQRVFVECTSSLAAERPTIVCVDDLHLAPERGRSLFSALAASVAGRAVMLVGTMPGPPDAWALALGRSVPVRRVVLEPLGVRDMVRMLRATLRSEALAEELAGHVAAAAEGNPWLVLEVLRGLRASGAIVRGEGGSWAATRTLRDLVIPPGVSAMVQRRIDLIGGRERALLDVAACAGYEFDAARVGAALGVPQIPLLRTLGRIERSHHLVRAAGARFVFEHHEVHTALERAMPDERRREIHADLADAIEAQSGAAPPGGAPTDPSTADGWTCVALADHALRGGRREQAMRYVARACMHLRARFLDDAADALGARAAAPS